MTRMTVTPTGLATGEPANVIPPFADVVCDCRAVPGQGEAEIRAHVERASVKQIEHAFATLRRFDLETDERWQPRTDRNGRARLKFVRRFVDVDATTGMPAFKLTSVTIDKV